MSISDKISKLSEEDQFYHIFGRAMAAWAEVEYGLSIWFKACTGLDYDMAQNLFFSGRSFQTRRDLLHSTLETTNKISTEWREFIIAGLNKAKGYSGTRNRLAHGLMHPNALNEFGHPTSWRIKEPSEWEEKQGFAYTEIAVIADNFHSLANILTTSHYPHVQSAPPGEYVQRLHELPNEANSSQLSQKQKAQLAPSQSSGT